MFRFFNHAFSRANYVNNRALFTAIQKTTTEQTFYNKLIVLSSLSCSLWLYSKVVRKQEISSKLCCCDGNADGSSVTEGTVHYEIKRPVGDKQFKEFLENVRSSHPESPIFVLFMGKRNEIL